MSAAEKLDLDDLDADMVRACLAEAMDILKRSQFPRNGAPSGRTCFWPEVVRDFWESYNQMPEAKKMPRPTAAQMDYLDVILPWLYTLEDPVCRNVVYLRALGMSWRKIARAVNRSHEYARYVEDAGIHKILRAIKVV